MTTHRARGLAAPAVLALFCAAVLVPFLSLLLASVQPAGTFTGNAFRRSP